MSIEREAPHSPGSNVPWIRTKAASRVSTWVVIGFGFWIGFFIGAVILHAMVK